jgi:hypothetical protein
MHVTFSVPSDDNLSQLLTNFLFNGLFVFG